MAIMSLRVSVPEKGVVKTMQFEPSTLVYDACKIIREKMPEANLGQAKDYGLFLSDEDSKKGVWMENGRTLEYYLVRTGDMLEYKKKIRTLRVRMLDGAVKTLMVDDSQAVGQLMVVICTRIGITNHEEYSLVREQGADLLRAPSTPLLKREEEKERGKMGTLTLGRSKEKKMEQLRKQLHTDEELNWVDHSKTLREQGIDENENLLLRRKYFFSDQNIDARDPVQLNLLYVQCRDGILDGTHPVSQDEAFAFAGLQCQIQFGDFVETKHRSGFLDVREFLPVEYTKVKGAEKRIMQEYKKNNGIPEVDAKVKYTQRCRSLPTYGVTFFLVKEKIKGKNRLSPRLLGVNKECVMRIDEKTKQVLQIWSLEQVRRWAASPNTFTLDFGDYRENYFSVQTADGEKIAQLIAGYIDIILKKKKAKDHFGIDGDEGSTMLEDTVAPAKATLISHGTIKEGHAEESNIALPGVMRAGMNGELPYGSGSLQRAAQYGAIGGQILSTHLPPQGQQPKVYDTMSKAQRALVASIESAEHVIERAEIDLKEQVQLPPLGDDMASKKWVEQEMETNKQQVESQLASMGAATAEVVQLTGVPERIDYVAVGAAVSTISSNLPDMTRGVKNIAALLEEEERKTDLIGATRRLCGAFSDLMIAVNPQQPEPRHQVLAAAGRVGDASHAMIQTIEEPSDESKEFQDILVQLAKAVATSTAQLVLKAKTVSSMCEDQTLQDRVIHSATQCAFATSQLVACARVVAPTIDSPACQEQLTDAAKQVARAVEQLLKDAELSCPQDDRSLGDLRDAARQVTEALSALLGHIRSGPRARATLQDREVETIITTTEKMASYEGSSNEMVRQAKVLAEATTHLVTHIKGEAEVREDDGDSQRLMGAARHLADATTRMIEAAKSCASSPHEATHQLALKAAAEDVRSATTVAASDQIRFQIIRRLEQVARQAASSATQTIVAGKNTDQHNKNLQTAQELARASQETNDLIPDVLHAAKKSQMDPHSVMYQSELLRISREFMTPAANLVNASRGAVPTVEDGAAAAQLSNSGKQLGTDLAELRTIITKAQDAFVSSELEISMQIISSLEAELVEFRQHAEQGRLHPLPGDTIESAATQLNQSTKTVGSSMAKLLSATAQGDEEYVGRSAQDTAEGLRHLSQAVRASVATDTENVLPKERLIDAGRMVMVESNELLGEVKSCLSDPNRPDNQHRLSGVAKRVTFSLNSCVNCLPGQQNLDTAIHTITSTVEHISITRLQPTVRSYAEVQEDLMHVAGQLTDSLNRVIANVGRSPQELAASIEAFMLVFRRFVTVSLEAAYLTEDPAVREAIVESLRALAKQTGRLLVSIKSSSADPHAPSVKAQLNSTSREVTHSINVMINLCTSSAPWQKECDNALRSIQSMRPLLESPSEPIVDYTYYECLDVVTESSKSLGDGMTGIAHNAKNGDLNEFTKAVREVSDAVCNLAESAAQAAYLAGASDLASVRGRPGLVDMNKFNRSSNAVRDACASLQSPQVSQHQVLECATVIARHTSILANVCRDASARTSDAATKKQFINYARDVAGSTANLIKTIKVVDADFSDAHKRDCADSTIPLLNSLDNLTSFASSPAFASVPAKISSQGRALQRPLLDPSRRMLDGACEMISVAKHLAVNPKDPPTWQLLANHSKIVSDSIKTLVSAIRDKAPGQTECDHSMELINYQIQRLDQASMEALNQSLAPRHEQSEQAYHEQMTNSTEQIVDRVDELRQAAKFEAENIGHRVTDICGFFQPLADACIGAASLSYNSRRQMALLDQCKTVCEAHSQLLYCVKDAGGNPKADEYHQQVDESADTLKDALSDLQGTLSQAVAESGVLSTTLEIIHKAITRTDETVSADGISYVDLQTRMVRNCKEIARISQEMVSKSYTNTHELGQLALELSRHYSELADDTRYACAVCAGSESAFRIRSSVQELGTACIELVKYAGSVRGNPSDTFAKRDLADSARIVSEKVAYVLAALQSSSRGTQACINAASTVSGIIGDLDTTIMFATAGTLNPEKEGDVFSDHREAILKTAKALVEDTKALVSGAASSQEQLAVAAQNAVRTIVNLSDVVKSGAAALTSQNSEAQVLVINAVKDVAAALANLIQATKNASGKSFNDPAMVYLKDAAKVMVTNVTSLLKTVKTVEDEHQRGTRALEAAIEAIAQEIRAYDADEQPTRQAKPEELIRVTKPVTDATGKAVAAGQSLAQDDVIVAANMGRKVVADLLTICKATASHAENSDAKYRALDAGRDVGIKVRELLQALHLVLQKPTQDSRQLLVPASRNIAQAVTDLVAYAEILKGSDWIDPSDPTVIAENELLGAANSIEAAARKLALLKPRSSAYKAADESLNFDEQIIEAARSIATAVSALVKAASAAQRELVVQGRVDPNPRIASEDYQWSEGLVSAARMVAAATHSLCEAANALVQGHATEEKLISAAKQVASSTAQLLVACQVKADMNSKAMHRLQAAGNAVKTATEHLVRAAKQAIEAEDERTLVISQRMVGGIAQVLDAQEEVLRKERELGEARVKLAAIRKAKYRDNPAGGLDSKETSPEPASFASDF